MYLQKLELQGFKSFAQNTSLEFQRGISAVVGPNGSGKSNIADALRFVLGEQSMKSIRSKKGEDLIFSGSPAKSRAGMAFVALHFNNEDRAFPVEFETVVIKRTIFRDGENRYFVNEAQVLLKDLAELIAKAKLGLKGYTIINQGMGDAILDASARDRKEIIFSALGLKEFQLKRADALLKLSHTQVNLEKAEGITKEIEPHLKFLKRQAEKMQERRGIEEKLKKMEVAYAAKRMRAIQEKIDLLFPKAAENERRVADLQLAVFAATEVIEKEIGQTSDSFADTAQLENALIKEEGERNSIEREIGRIEGMIAATKRESVRFAPVDALFIRNAMEQLHQSFAVILEEKTYQGMRAKLDNFALEFSELLKSIQTGKIISRALPPQEEVVDNSFEFSAEQKRFVDLLKKSDDHLKEIKDEIKQIQTAHGKSREHIFELKNIKREKETELRHAEESYKEMKAEIARLNTEIDIVNKEKEFLQGKEGIFLIEDDASLSFNDEEMRKNIERMKIRLENIDLIDNNIGKEYEETQKRYDFLMKESEDLRQAISSFHAVVAELDSMISLRFHEAFKKINENFNAYFRLLFEGGSARLEISDDAEEVAPEPAQFASKEKRKETGVEIEVSLPRKKTAGLSVLSGGERALTSLALLFALVSTSPPPFLVLDEIDAPLDEANSMRFGKIVSELKHHTQFVIITHNRETMRQADALWGITMQEEGISKLLSLKFDTAKEMVK